MYASTGNIWIGTGIWPFNSHLWTNQRVESKVCSREDIMAFILLDASDITLPFWPFFSAFSHTTKTYRDFIRWSV